MFESTESKSKRKRSPKKYWRVIKGNLYARLQYQDETGKWREKLKPISDKRTAQSVVNQMRQELEAHGEEMIQSDKLKFAQLVEHYRKTKLTKAKYSNNIKVSGRRSLGPVNSAIKPLLDYFGNRRIRNIKASDLESYKTNRLNTPTNRGTIRKIASVNRELEILRAMLNFAIQNEWLIKNPFALAKGVISKAAEVERDRVLSFEEESRLLEACTGRRVHLRPLIICALDTAMRRGEMFKMQWRDVNFVSREIFIPQTNTKTENSRTVGITNRLLHELETLWDRSPKDPNRLVFGLTSTVKTAWKSTCTKAGIKDFRLHDCRHTATTRMIASGSPHTEVMKITGHTQLKTFLRYLNMSPESTNRIASNLNDYMDSKSDFDGLLTDAEN